MKTKDLYNQKNKEQLISDLKKENFRRITLSFYKYIELNELEKLRNTLFLEWKQMNILGRVYIASEGINAQISIPENNIESFKYSINNRIL